MYPSAYFPPAYFPSAYFSNPGATPPTDGGYSDRTAYATLVAALESTGRFAGVAFATPVDATAARSDGLPLAVVLPGPWAERAAFGSAGRLRSASFTVTLVVRGTDAGGSFDEAERLSTVVQGAIAGSDLGGGCLPALTTIARGRPDFDAPFPEQRVVLEGQFTYAIPASA